MVKKKVTKKKSVRKKAIKKKHKWKPSDALGPRPIGKTMGLGVEQTWVVVFRKNALASQRRKKTDEQITAFMKAEFPGRNSAVFDRVSSVRNKYNRGDLTGRFYATVFYSS